MSCPCGLLPFNAVMFLSVIGGAFVAAAEERNWHPSLWLAASVERNH